LSRISPEPDTLRLLVLQDKLGNVSYLSQASCCPPLSSLAFQLQAIPVNAFLHFLNLVSSYFCLQNISEQSCIWVAVARLPKGTFGMLLDSKLTEILRICSYISAWAAKVRLSIHAHNPHLAYPHLGHYSAATKARSYRARVDLEKLLSLGGDKVQSQATAVVSQEG
jgi:hypothetical protein